MKIRKWIRPECIKVKLVPEEAVLWGCKGLWQEAIAKDGIWGSCARWPGSNCPSLAS